MDPRAEVVVGVGVYPRPTELAERQFTVVAVAVLAGRRGQTVTPVVVHRPHTAAVAVAVAAQAPMRQMTFLEGRVDKELVESSSSDTGFSNNRRP
jgi:hypothetical protein